MTLGMIFTAFLVMLGPTKMIFPFAALTAGVAGMDEAKARRASAKAIGIACLTGIVAAILGQSILSKWGISLQALHLAAGLVLLLVALQSLMATYAPSQNAPAPVTPPKNFILSPLVYPIILSPYGIATFILVLASTGDIYRDLQVFAVFLLVMAINLATLWYAQAIVRRGASLLMILGAIFGVLQVALAIEMMLDASRGLHILPNL